MNIPLNLKEEMDDVKEKGDASIYQRMKTKSNGDGARMSTDEVESYGLAMCCPKCGQGMTGNHKYDPSTKSLTPSIVHNVGLGGCGYHGWLKNGVFTNV